MSGWKKKKKDVADDVQRGWGRRNSRENGHNTGPALFSMHDAESCFISSSVKYEVSKRENLLGRERRVCEGECWTILSKIFILDKGWRHTNGELRRSGRDKRNDKASEKDRKMEGKKW